MPRWNTFVIRLWNDSTSGPWRGEIVHLQSAGARHFTTWDEVEAFVLQFVPGLGAPPGPAQDSQQVC
jgi:hypothetical protein